MCSNRPSHHASLGPPGVRVQRSEIGVFGKASDDLCMWVMTPHLERWQLERFGCAHKGDVHDFEDACFTESTHSSVSNASLEDADQDLEVLEDELPDWYRELSTEDVVGHGGGHLSHVSTHRPGSGEWLALRQNMKTNVTVVRTAEEVELFIDLLRRHITPNGKVDYHLLCRDFNKEVLERPLGCSLKFKTAGYLKEYADYLAKRVQVDHAQPDMLTKVRPKGQCDRKKSSA